MAGIIKTNRPVSKTIMYTRFSAQNAQTGEVMTDVDIIGEYGIERLSRKLHREFGQTWYVVEFSTYKRTYVMDLETFIENAEVEMED